MTLNHKQLPNDLDLKPSNVISEIPLLCSSMNRNDALNKCLKIINSTNTTESKHKSCVCVICKCVIVGTEPICWLSEDQLKAK